MSSSNGGGQDSNGIARGGVFNQAKAKACDILISGADAMRLFAVAQKHGVSGIGMNQRGEHSKRFVHLDTLTPEEGPRPTVWTYG